MLEEQHKPTDASPQVKLTALVSCIVLVVLTYLFVLGPGNVGYTLDNYRLAITDEGFIRAPLVVITLVLAQLIGF